MTSTSTPIKDSPVWIFISLLLVIFLGGYLFGPCKGSSERPNTVPKDASFDKKTNHYQMIGEGYFREWYENGNLVAIVPIDSLGRPDGIGKKLNYIDGTTIMEGKMVNGERDGLWKFYFSDGKIYIEQNYKAGYRKKQLWIQSTEIGNENGAYFRYYRNGRLNEKGFFDGGLRTGDWVRYYPDTKVEAKGSYSEDKKIGEWFYYYPTGVKEASELYSDTGELISRNTYYPNGNPWCIVKQNKTPECN
ncbi:hypothetical protein ND860_12795 [Leptospira levettii]|uniref:Toxin-antitoxin system YwqK family antitoxin n=1 Tax=Leptospira levettii TaxID=2023178 RepID=A0AAW5VCT5_9LEPT|nr:hypothetical protein [Leptospira levettii]MCW7466929.1 hypothetical protein [Leptospira levettii]MCW7497411.1 hypothetical protein [Leptospira levettii]MCW7512651.1 hypothetical protein [Leptospira levettii]MCW7516085.1 hypothetical protein [Leptospira levettii]TGM85870.1 hypothetical protein EHR00_02895 [Leptospira levettii]